MSFREVFGTDALKFRRLKKRDSRDSPATLFLFLEEHHHGNVFSADASQQSTNFTPTNMVRSRSRGSAQALTLLLFVSFFLPLNALHFYVNGNQPKCFYEELPKDTLVVGQSSPRCSRKLSRKLLLKFDLGYYEAHQLNPQTRQFELDPNMGVTIIVEETFDNDHRIVNQRGASKGRFTFSAADSGEHKLCFQPTNTGQSGGWLVGGQDMGGVKMILDMVIGETSKIESKDKGKVEDLVSKVKDLNGRLQDIRREQVFQRVRIDLLELPD